MEDIGTPYVERELVVEVLLVPVDAPVCVFEGRKEAIKSSQGPLPLVTAQRPQGIVQLMRSRIDGMNTKCSQ